LNIKTQNFNEMSASDRTTAEKKDKTKMMSREGLVSLRKSTKYVKNEHAAHLQRIADAASKAILANQTNRYQKPMTQNEDHAHLLLKAEEKFAKLLGVKYCVGVNSGGTALKFCLQGIEDRVTSKIVLTNAFTFNAVPSAIVNAGFIPHLVETTPSLCIDLEDLELQIENTGAQILMLSYMRGFVPDLDAILEICERRNVILVEDCAHAYGIQYKGKMVGSFGVASGLSTQSNKLINTGEGGFLLTNDEEIMARSIIAAGSYEKHWMKHGSMTPSEDMIERFRKSVPNQSVRLSNVQGAMASVQFDDINERISALNGNFSKLKSMVSGNPNVKVIMQANFITTPVYDSIQMKVDGLTQAQRETVQDEVQKKYKFQIFMHPENARYYKSWHFMEWARRPLPVTERNLENVFDMRISHTATTDELSDIATTILESVEYAKSGEHKVGEETLTSAFKKM